MAVHLGKMHRRGGVGEEELAYTPYLSAFGSLGKATVSAPYRTEARKYKDDPCVLLLRGHTPYTQMDSI